jgi:hypothetical protein
MSKPFFVYQNLSLSILIARARENVEPILEVSIVKENRRYQMSSNTISMDLRNRNAQNATSTSSRDSISTLYFQGFTSFLIQRCYEILKSPILINVGSVSKEILHTVTNVNIAKEQ